MKTVNLLELLNKKFDEYHTKQLKIDDNQNPDYYLFMGKANAIGEVIDEIKKYERYDRELASGNWKNVILKASI